jgi:tetraacyldisaccharide 4'-kinase
LLLCGIANPAPLKEYLTTKMSSYDMLRYPDHHIFNSDDLADIKKQFEKIQNTNKLILTTEKDAVRLVKFEEDLKDFPICVLPIEHSFMFGEAAAFDKLVVEFMAAFKK